MFYKLILQLNFTEPDHINDILDKVKDSLEDAITINKGEENVEVSHYQFQKCFHDENPHVPCEVINQFATLPSP